MATQTKAISEKEPTLVGWAERSDAHLPQRPMMGIAFALPTLRVEFFPEIT